MYRFKVLDCKCEVPKNKKVPPQKWGSGKTTGRSTRPEPGILLLGKKFEIEEKKEWESPEGAKVTFEQALELASGRGGRIDIFLDEDGGYVSILEVKSTNWDRIKPYRRRPNLLRHARQVLRYVVPFIEQGIDVCPGVVYPKAPKEKAVLKCIEDTLNDLGLQVVWADQRDHSPRNS